MEPSFRVSISLARSSPMEASTTARRLSTTLLRLRSSLMTLNSMVLFSYGVRSLIGACVDQRTGQEGADAVDQNGQAALDLAAGGAGDEFAGFQGLFQAHPGSQALGGVTRQDGVAVTVFDGADGHRNEVTDLDFDFALVVLELFHWHVGFGLEASVHDDEVVLNAHDFGGDDFAWAHFRALQRFFKQGGKRFGHVFPCHNRFPAAPLLPFHIAVAVVLRWTAGWVKNHTAWRADARAGRNGPAGPVGPALSALPGLQRAAAATSSSPD